MGYYNNSTNPLVNGTIADATEVEGKHEEVVASFNTVQSDMDKRLVLSNSDNSDRDITENAVDRSNTLLSFNASGDLALLPKASAGTGLAWGSITGDMYNQTDLKDRFALTGRNLIINGDFTVWQRGSPVSTSTAGAYGADRWTTNASFLGVTYRETNSASYPALHMTRDAPRSYMDIAQVIEFPFYSSTHSLIPLGDYVLSFELKPDITTSAYAKVQWAQYGHDNAGSSVFLDESNIKQCLAGEWTKVEVTFPIDVSPVSGDVGLSVSIGSRGYTFQIGEALRFRNVQLERGTVATEFEAVNPSLQLANCQRYFWRSPKIRWSAQNDGTLNYHRVAVPVTLREVPSVTYSGFIDTDSSGLTIVSISTDTGGIQNINMNIADTIGNRYVVTNFDLDAEI